MQIINFTMRLLLISTLLVSAGLALGQRKPDPLPFVPQQTDRPDMLGFSFAYEAAGFPRILIMTGMDNRMGDSASAEATRGRAATGSNVASGVSGSTLQIGTPANSSHIGRNLSFFHSSGVPQMLEASMEEILQKNPDIELVNLDAQNEAQRREIGLLWLQNENAAIQLLKRQTNAEVVLVVRMLPQPGFPYRVLVKMLETNRGRSIGSFAFDWQLPGTDSNTVKLYAGEITRKFTEQFSSWYTPSGRELSSRYTIRLLGVKGVSELAAISNMLRDTPGVSRVINRGFSASSQSTVTELQVNYNGDALSLVGELASRAAGQVNMNVDALDISAGSITLRATSHPKLTRAVSLVNVEAHNHNELVRELRNVYLSAGQPKIGLIINRELRSEELDRSKSKKQLDLLMRERKERLSLSGEASAAQVSEASVGTMIMVAAGDINAGDRDGNVSRGKGHLNQLIPTLYRDYQKAKNHEKMLSVVRVENAIVKRFLKMGLDLVDPNRVRGELAKGERAIFDEDEMAWRLGRDAGLDIVILGRGKVHETGGITTVTYTFRAVRVADGVILAADLYTTDLDLSANQTLIDQVVEHAADYVAGNMADQMWSFWEPPNRLTVTVHNADSPKDVVAVMNALKQSVEGVDSVSFDRHEAIAGEGKGVFVLRYRKPYEELIQAIADQADQLSMDYDPSGSTRDTLGLRLRD